MIRQLPAKFFYWYGVLFISLSSLVPALGGTGAVADTCVHPRPPVIAGSATSICQNESVTLSATGCAGTIVWSNGEVGNSITVRPQQTSRYTAICRAEAGCISCFADVWTIRVNTPAPPVIVTSAKAVCPDAMVSLTATNCSGTVRWLGMNETGSVWAGKITQTTTFRAICDQNNCQSNPSLPVLVQIATPEMPIVSVDKKTVCAGQSVRLTASGCLGTVRWSDGETGQVRIVMPYETATYRALCELGTCRSDSSLGQQIIVHTVTSSLSGSINLTNRCPFQTADLTRAVEKHPASETIASYLFKKGPSPGSADVQSPGAVQAGVYYVFGRTREGCFSEPMAVTVRVDRCQNSIPPCLSNPATVVARIDSLNWSSGIVYLQSKLGGSAEQAMWQSSGGGLFTDAGLQTRYLLSETDRQRGHAGFTLTTADPDGAGPCTGAIAQLTAVAPETSRLLTESGKLPKDKLTSVETVAVDEGGEGIFIPEGFSPNGDGINDRFVLQHVPVGVTVRLEVYNRWGHPVYLNNAYANDWDGTTNQLSTGSKQDLPDGTYYYQVRLSDGREFARFLTLVR